MANCQMKKAQKYTMGKLWNSTSETVTLSGKKVWHGSHDADFPETIEDGDVGEFTHDAVTEQNDVPGSVVGLVYKLHDGTRWIVAWSNPQGEDSKVYTNIHKEPIRWEQIKTDLDTRGSSKSKVRKFGYVSSIEIDPKKRSPTLKASFESEA
ncbi:hypothetical protein E1A91_A05G305800v1 [Gossypium mustelinum]|uniref:Uncharacterized protein n=4 Tax=Gossypium TaxID=3633 RepID=A0A2P5YQ55_GOSBA|nr:hypothetical protein ES319_A05G298000v1 [Gossypium barbadense]PPS17698.1 hypothetical protein GOBAR_AA02870 [Gossypium barbadense]TYH18921.1 hypothetical protein ES288_A05G311600v1 [Gossypium darwinii]TYI29405.1 hypothetical protein ES332_A05G314400v1 [Gossypium tomentosum]TYJ36424.1 hypothetical protein E1A91_A05G305800v1 [Gossypium mustelinum]